MTPINRNTSAVTLLTTFITVVVGIYFGLTIITQETQKPRLIPVSEVSE